MGKTNRVCTGIVSSSFTADFIVLGETIRLKWPSNDEITHRTVYCWNSLRAYDHCRFIHGILWDGNRARIDPLTPRHDLWTSKFGMAKLKSRQPQVKSESVLFYQRMEIARGYHDEQEVTFTFRKQLHSKDAHRHPPCRGFAPSLWQFITLPGGL
jgi:hypothetical protein